jgi:hypothetical protein
MDKKTRGQDTKARGHWETPRLEFKGRVGEILKSGGGKLSVTGADSGEMRCEKPHTHQCG